MNQPNWLSQVQQDAENMPFGTMTFTIKRHRNKTTKIEIKTDSTLKYADNVQVFADIEQLMNNLIASRFTGTLQFEQTYKDGDIQTVTIKNKKTLNYRDKQ